MPTLKIQTNVPVADGGRASLIHQISAAVSQMLGKPEAYVMVILEDGRDMLFAGSTDPAAYLELKSLALPEDQTARLCESLCDLVERLLGVPPSRTYIELTSPPRHMFGWDRSTF